MRRALLVAAVAAPAIALGQVSAPPGRLLEVDNFNADPQVLSSYVNAAQCAGDAPVRLEWNIGSTTFLPDESYQIYATDSETIEVNGTPFCREEDATGGVGGDNFAEKIADVPATRGVESLEVTGAAIVVTGANLTCDSASERQVVFVCAHWYAADLTTRKGSAVGKFIVQLAAPAPPTNVRAAVGETRLQVSWDPSSGSVDADRYVAIATPADSAGVPLPGAVPISSDEVTGTTTTIENLTNDQPYRVVVRSISIGGNRSGDSDAVIETPRFVDDFWESYLGAGGQEKGGCSAGSAGSLALLAVAGLLAALRRRP